jgi:hypothetical protein
MNFYSQESRPLLYVLLERSPHLANFLKIYLPAILFGYFGLIILANSFGVTWLTDWLAIWSVAIDALREILPIFDKTESRLASLRLSHRVALVHHLLFAGWLIFAVAVISCSAAVARISRGEWVKIAQARSTRSFAMWCLGLLLILAGMFFFVSIGINQTGNVLYAWERYDPQLLWFAAAFYGALVAWIGALITFIAALVAYQSGRTTPVGRRSE